MRLIILLIVLISNGVMAQTVADFESFGLAQDTFLNGADGSEGFDNGNIFLPNSYDDMWGSWSGWSISSMTDTTTPGFSNQYSCISGGGVDGSATYATTFVAGESLLVTTGAGQGGVIEGFYINNATYTYLSMKDGDAFAKKFGGETGTDPDYLYLSIKEYGASNAGKDSIIFYLADYRSDDPAEDYIVDEWTLISLLDLNNVDTLSFQLYSSDVGMFGMNTPAYFCIDNFITTDMKLTSTTEAITNEVTLYPNPTSGQLWIESDVEIKSYSLYDISGNVLKQREQMASIGSINLGRIDPGMYMLRLESIDGKVVSRLISKQ